jgi:hypothetical protein
MLQQQEGEFSLEDSYANALCAAAAHGNLAAVELLLLEDTIDVNVQV